MLVQLIAHTNDPEKTIAAAAKLCYSDAHIETLLDGLTPEKTEAFLQRLNDVGHASPIEHASFTFGIEGVSRTFLAQVTRHRIGSFSVQSQRYVRLEDFRYVIPPEIEAIPEAKAQFIASMNDDAKKYLELVQTLENAHTARFMADGLDEKAARAKASKQANEDARFVLPNACETKMVRRGPPRRWAPAHDDELPQLAEFLQPALLQPRPVGDSRRRGRDAAAGAAAGPAHLRERRPAVPRRPLPGGPHVLRQTNGSTRKIRQAQGGGSINGKAYHF